LVFLSKTQLAYPHGFWIDLSVGKAQKEEGKLVYWRGEASKASSSSLSGKRPFFFGWHFWCCGGASDLLS
jgi:hypothetical protein